MTSFMYFYNFKIKTVKMRKVLFANFVALLLAGSMLTSCSEYTAQDYIDDLKELTETTAENASSYTKEDWQKVAEEFKEINEKGAEVCKELTEEQAKEIKKIKKELMKEASDFDSEELKKELENMADKAGEALKELFSK